MLRLITPTHFEVWQRPNVDDAPLLEAWRDAPLTFEPAMAETGAWHVDLYERTVARGIDAARFAQARALLLTYRFYPPRIMTHVGDFSRAGRPLAVNDLIVQRLHLANLALNVPRLLGRSPVDLLTMNRVTAVVDEPRRAGFTYTTTTRHREVGAWSAAIEWQTGGDLRLIVQATARPAADEPRRNHRLMRRLQLKAHRLGINHFTHHIPP
jgi:uncharacterized protein (UPF0548 family)